MNKDLTYIAVVMDESGSMAGVRDETLGGLNTFFADQAKKPGMAKATLVMFNSVVKWPNFIDVPLSEVKELTHEDYSPGGMTALYDAIGDTMNSLGQRIQSLPEEQRPGNVIFIIQTDGQENASRRFNLLEIKEMIARQKASYNWDFVFLGADINAFDQGGMLGIDAKSTLSYAKGSSRNTFDTVSLYASNTRSMGAQGNLGFSIADRAKAVTKDA